MVRPERFELPTYSSGGCRSIQLSYGRTPVFPVYMRSFTLSIDGSKVGVSEPLRRTEYFVLAAQQGKSSIDCCRRPPRRARRRDRHDRDRLRLRHHYRSTLGRASLTFKVRPPI